MAVGEKKALGEILLESGIIQKEQLDQALNYQSRQGGALGTILVELGYVSEEDILLALGAQAGMEVVDLENAQIDPEIITMVSSSIANAYRIVPVAFQDGMLTVAMSDPLNVNALDDLRFMVNCEVKGALSSETSVNRAIEKYYGSETESIDDLISEISSEDMKVLDTTEDSNDIANLEAMANQMPVVKLLNLVLLTAIKDQSSDIHFEPFEDEFKIRYRIDGVLLEMQPPPKQLSLALISRIKVMSNLDIAERRLPQDGRIELNISGNPIDLRVSTLPTMFGESVVMRVLDRSVVSLDLQRIGLRQEDYKYIGGLIDLPHGIILVTGPTGSGKTTTLYSALNEANDVGIKIITTEDPVEYELEGIVQVPINEEIEVTYAACLRSILRQDPDKILVGEIRDLETADIAIEASLTGHVVFSTLHTNDAPSTITRLLDLGVEPFLICATLEAIIAQRLVRVICTRCKDVYVPSREILMELNLKLEDIEGRKFYYGKGCDHCNKTGFRGRTALFEIMKVNAAIREMIMQEKSTEVLRAAAHAQGMHTLREAGILKILDGITTIEEVIRETMAFE